MAHNFLDVKNIDYSERYSLKNVQAQIEKMRHYPERAKEAEEFQRLCAKYPSQFPALYKIKDEAFVDEEDGQSLSMVFEESEYHRPDVDTEEHDTVPPSQLKLTCTFEDGSSFGLSALPTIPNTADEKEPQRLRGEISFAEETLKNLNEEKFKRIMDFCDKYGFSIACLRLPIRGGEIDVDEKLDELLKKYQEQKDRDAEPSVKPSEDEDTDEGFRKEDFIALVDEAAKEEKIPEAEAAMEPAPAEEEKAEEKPAEKPSFKKRMTLEEMVNNVRLFIEKDLYKLPKLSYWEHHKIIDGRDSYVFSIYDTENAENYHNDGKKTKDGQYKTTASCRLMVSQDKSGKFFFGYTTPSGTPIKQDLATDFLGEIKKAGITHLNFTNIPKRDKMTFMIACAENGIIPKNLSFSKGKVEKMLQSAQSKLSTDEYTTFIENLMDQWEAETAKKGKTLATSDQEYIRKCRNDAVNKRADQYGQLEKAEFEKKFKNFRDTYNAPDGLRMEVDNLIVKGGMDKQTGAATQIAAMSSLARTFDIVFGTAKDKKGALDISLGERLDELAKNPMVDNDGKPTVIRITDEEKRILAPLAAKQIKDLTKEDYLSIFNLFYKRQLKESTRAIIECFKEDRADTAHAKAHILMGEVWNRPVKQVQQVRLYLESIGAKVDPLDLPDKHAGLSAEKLKAIAIKEYEAEKAAKEAAKPGVVKPTPAPERGRE